MERNSLSTLFDGFEHIGVYVVDRDSLVVYYENALAEKYTGRRRIGEPCYQAHGNDEMCSVCPIRRREHLSLVNRSDYNLVFAVRSEEVCWDGKDAYLITVVKREDSSRLSVDEKSMSRMRRALQKSVSVYTEINMETLHYRQLTLNDGTGYTGGNEGDYPTVFAQLCEESVHPDDRDAVRRGLAPEVLKRLSYESEGASETVVRYRMKYAVPERMMETRVIFLRDEVPHYVVCIAQDVTEATQLRRQTAVLEGVLNNVSCGVAVYQIEKNSAISIEYLNEGLARLMECSREELQRQAQQDPLCGLSPDSRAAFRAAIHRLWAGEKTIEKILGVATSRGHQRWTNMTLTAARKENDTLQVYGTYYDVTADIQVQREFLEKYEIEKRRTQNDATVLAYGVFDLQDGRTLEMERRKPFQALAAPMALDDFCADIATAIPSEESRARFAALFNMASILAQHENGVDEQSLEYQRRLPSGKIIWVKSSFHLIADLSTNTTLLFYYCNDIHLSKSLELMTAYMVDEDYDRLGNVNLRDDSAIMLYGKNSSWRTAGNQRLQTQESHTEALGWYVNHFVVPEERGFYQAGTFLQQIREKLAEKPSCEFVLHVLDAAGCIRTKKIRYTRDETNPDSCFFTQVDVTETLAEEEKKQLELQAALQSAKQANEAKTNFLARMSHDMRTPMNGVLGLAALMRDETDPKKLAEDLSQLEMSGRYLLQLINDTLDVNKIEAGKLELRLKPINSAMVFGNIISNAQLQAVEKGVHLTLDLPQVPCETQVPVMADASRLEQIFMNVISNAIKFTPVGGTVTLRVQPLERTATQVVERYIVQDSGIGMSKAFLAHIFEPFSQEGRANTERESGTGLGMSIVRQLVELMHGEISIESEIGKGTVVTLLLRYPVCTQPPEPADKAQVALSVLQNKRFLLCEDHPLNAQIAERLLAKKGATLTRAENGREGVALFAKSQPGDYDMILMDIRMPEMNGLDATRAIRALPRPDAKTIPILAMTANAFEDDVQDCLAAGMNGHIPKPIDPATLYETIAECL